MHSDPPPIVSTQGQTRWIHLETKIVSLYDMKQQIVL